MVRILAILVAVIAVFLIAASLMHFLMIAFWIALAGLVVFGAFRIGRRTGGGRPRE